MRQYCRNDLRSKFFFKLICNLLFLTTPFIAANSALSQNTATLPAVVGLLLDNDCTGTRTIEHDVTLITQEDVNALSDVAIINGLLVFEQTSNLDLKPLNNLLKTGGLSMFGNSVQTHISGFNCLESIGEGGLGGLILSNNSALLELSGFKKLEIVGGSSLIVSDNSSLTRMEGFTNLKSVSGSLRLFNNPLQESLPPFNRLETIGSSLLISNLDGLETISGFNKLEAVAANATILESSSLVEISGFEALTMVGGNLQIGNHVNLERVMGFGQLEDGNIFGESNISVNPKFDCLNPEPGFTPVLKSFQNLQDCPTLGRTFIQVDVSGIGSDTSDEFGMFYGSTVFGAGQFNLTEESGGQTFEGIPNSAQWFFQQETAPNGYTLTAINCTSNRDGATFSPSLGNRSVEFFVFIDEIVECKFDNEFTPP